MRKTVELFDTWNEKKKDIEFTLHTKIDARVGEFRWYREGINIGNEISKDGLFKRVCIILDNNLGNGLYLIAPLTTKYHHWMRTKYLKVNNYQKYKLKESRIILNQIKIIDKKRISHITGTYKPFVSFVTHLIEAYVFLIQKRPRSTAR